MIIGREYKIDSAHYLTKTGPDKCRDMHGHTYRLLIEIESETWQDMVLDFHELDGIVEAAVISYWDHKLINITIEEPTVENMVNWVVAELNKMLTPVNCKLKQVKIYEGPGAWARIESPFE